MTVEQAADFIRDGDTVGMSGFTGAGYPKALPGALVNKAQIQRDLKKPFKINLWTGASTAPELDGVLADADGINLRLPYQSDPICRQQINSGQILFTCSRRNDKRTTSKAVKVGI